MMRCSLVVAICVVFAACSISEGQADPTRSASDRFEGLSSWVKTRRGFELLRKSDLASLDQVFQRFGLRRTSTTQFLGTQWSGTDSSGSLRLSLESNAGDDRGSAEYTPATQRPLQPQVLSFLLARPGLSFEMAGGETFQIAWLAAGEEPGCETLTQMKIDAMSGALIQHRVSGRCAPQK